LLTVGYRRIETTTGFLTENLPPSTIHLNSSAVHSAAKTYQGVYIAELLKTVVEASSGIVAKKQPARTLQKLDFVPSNEPLTQDQYWNEIRNFLQPGDVIVVEDGTPSNGLSPLTLPENCTFISQAFVYCSIGYATGALLGAILASPGRRHFLFTGDGSLQMTVQEISTVMRHGLKPFIFVGNNGGYTVERAVLGRDAIYNDVANWRYSELPNVLSDDNKAETYVVRTGNDLQRVLDSPHSGMVFVECVTEKYDAPLALIVGGHGLADSDYGVPGPQAKPNAQLDLPKTNGKLTPA
jgi:indolepyruvate decarboxylase